MDRPILTIAVPTYNGAKTIRNMLDILLPQVDEKVEVLISDNCSNDETPQIIAEYCNKYPFIKSIRNEKNIGADGNFLQCMLKASGKFVMLISDDDIIVEGAVHKIVSFLESNQDVSLAYLHTVGFNDKYMGVINCYEFKVHSKSIETSLVTMDKKEFFSYADRQWGFTSSFLCNTDRCKLISNPEQYFSTYWLQSYIHICCSNQLNDKLGIIGGPCVAVGGYGIIGNYDVAQVEGVYYKKMLDYAVETAGYDKKQLEQEWLWKVCYLSKRTIIKERAIGIQKTSIKTLFKVLNKYPYAWLNLFPFFLLPKSLCGFILKIVRKKQGRKFTSYVNRPTEQ